VVEDAWQGRGLGPVLLDALLATAEARGLRTFTADVLAQNRPMLRVISRLAAIRRRELNGDVLTIEFERGPVASQSEGR
jgi:RimJ/RimL family protein N-acetyltransferase